jgi:hypothetical protein
MIYFPNFKKGNEKILGLEEYFLRKQAIFMGKTGLLTAKVNNIVF